MTDINYINKKNRTKYSDTLIILAVLIVPSTTRYEIQC